VGVVDEADSSGKTQAVQNDAAKKKTTEARVFNFRLHHDKASLGLAVTATVEETR
jgi:hypothetical protein